MKLQENKKMKLMKAGSCLEIFTKTKIIIGPRIALQNSRSWTP